jgi:hypothetical protein
MYTIKKQLFFLGIMICLMGANPMMSQNKIKVDEYVLKAKFLYAFINYVNWDSIAKNGEIKVAIIGESPITPSFININKNKKIKIIEYQDLYEIKNCDIVFIPSDSPYRLNSILSKFSKKPVLVVTEKTGYAKSGAHINFVLIQDKLKFEINLKALKETNLKVSSVLLQHAIIVK